MLSRCGLAACAAILTAGIATPTAGADLSVQRSPGFDLADVSTYAWKLPERPEGHPLVEGGRYDIHVRQIVDAALAERGLSLVADGTPDLWLTWDGVAHPGYKLEGVHIDLGPVTWIGDPDAHEAYGYERGVLVIAALDPATDETVWRGLATDIVDLARTDKILKKLDRAARQLMGDFPRP
ncbi:MAG: DUF4136 domain-containing protein [Thermoanaerobaculia bacterium]